MNGTHEGDGEPSVSRKRKTALLVQDGEQDGDTHRRSSEPGPSRPTNARAISREHSQFVREPYQLAELLDDESGRQSTRLDLASSTHFFSGHDGTTRIIGPTSGIALL